MSVLDQFRTAEEQVAKRLRELKPLVAEYHELEHVAQRLGLSVGDDESAAGQRRSASTNSARRRRRAAKTNAGRRRLSATEAPMPARQGVGRSDAGATGALAAGLDGNGRDGSSRSRRQQDVLRLVKQRPGITVSEIAKELGVDATGLYRPVHKLEQDGAILPGARRFSSPAAETSLASPRTAHRLRRAHRSAKIAATAESSRGSVAWTREKLQLGRSTRRPGGRFLTRGLSTRSGAGRSRGWSAPADRSSGARALRQQGVARTMIRWRRGSRHRSGRPR